ncbi:unnamed protein product [Tetraodon nigroviridis]|uniref:(spotted green pufferfish) hypothetical protein n=1 Tax=Tetraodon nigroviridis TaxID=99883 RepID=Q4SPH8_TETNG|nr:unnamed protein product [Tetraodon nigroviridis]
MRTRVRRGDARGQRDAAQISLKCHLKQTSSDKVMPFRCPSPSLKIKLVPWSKGGWKMATT